MNPDRQFVMSEIIKQTQMKHAAVKKELGKLVRLGLIKNKNVFVSKTKVKKITKVSAGTRRPKFTKNKNLKPILKRAVVLKKRK